MNNEERQLYNSKECSANKNLEFRSAVIVDAKDRNGKDYIRLDLVFNKRINIRLFDPSRSIRDRSLMSVVLSSLFEALGEDFGDIPPCRGGFHEFLSEVTEVLNKHKYTMLYAKLTVNEAGYVICGEGRCFSTKPDLEYTDADLHFLTVDEPVKSSPKESFMPEFEDISFEVIEEPTQEVTVYGEVTTVNDVIPLKEVGALNGADILSIEMTDQSDPVLDFLADGVVIEPEVIDKSDMIFDFTEPSDLDDLFSKPPEKASEGVTKGVNEGVDTEQPMVCGENTVLYDSPYVEKPNVRQEKAEAKVKKAPPRPKIPKGSDPLRYIHGDPEGEDWGPRENKIIDLRDLPS